jgi:hypothetical protein
VGVEEALDLAHRLVEVLAEDPAVELAAGAAVTVLARVHAVELRDEVDDLLRHRAHRLHAPGRGQVQVGADVQAADGAVTVEARGQPVPVEDLPEARDVLVQALGSDGGVLDEGERTAGARARRHEQPEP